MSATIIMFPGQTGRTARAVEKLSRRAAEAERAGDFAAALALAAEAAELVRVRQGLPKVAA
jgi:hypothetical protein